MSAESKGPKPAAVKADSDKSLAFLAGLAAEFTGGPSLPDLLERVAYGLREATGFDSCTIALLERREGDNVLVVRIASGVPEDQGGRGTVLRRDTGLVWQVLNLGTPLLVNDLHSHPRFGRKDPTTRSGIFAPLVANRRPIGVLSAYRSVAGGFVSSDLNLLTVVALYVAGAIEVARLHEHLKELAATDALTGLGNRRSFLDRLSGELDRCRRAGRTVTVALVDLNGFKLVNDTWGPAAGDEALIQFAETLGHGVRTYDQVVRFGGDEFALLLPEASRAKAEEILTRLQEVAILRTPHAGAGSRLVFSWGAAVFPDDGENIDELLRTAGYRLNAMKQPATR
jgi:diguanylate cyclase (GGDEF)-like protein